MRKFALAVAVLAMAAAPVWVMAQEGQSAAAAPQHYFRLNLVVEDLDAGGKVENARTFVTTVATTTGYPQEIRTGSRIPMPVGGDTQWQYMDVGVNFDVRDVKENGERLGFRLGADISSLAGRPAGQETGGTRLPVVRQNKWDSTVLIPIGTATVVYSADDLDSKGKMQVEVTAVRVE
jgi:opacity protein-like surface antigen